MGKKKKKRGKEKDRTYSKVQFRDIVCSQCRMCHPDSKPEFCYLFYLEDPKTFMMEVYGKLLKLSMWVETHLVSKDLISMPSFREVFCYAGICGYSEHGNKCGVDSNCYSDFKEQLLSLKGQGYKKTNKKSREVIMPYSTFFISNDENFRKQVEGILEDGNRDIEPGAVAVGTTLHNG